MSQRKSLDSKNSYSIGWITALPIERAAATALLDERHEDPTAFRQHESDHNSYTWGRIHNHNVVIASLSAGEYGLTGATRTAQGLIASLPHIKIGLLVGIGAGVPECGLDIQLGDVAVSRPNGTTSGVVQYDTGKAKSGGWERIGMLNRPPDVLLRALARLESEHELHGSQISKLLQKAGEANPIFAEKYKNPGLDNLQESSHQNKRPRLDHSVRSDKDPRIHYGTIGSGNMLVKDAETRRDIVSSIGSCICLEMEAAGLMNSFPCLIVRGISDYADANKNDLWQRYASATAAAFAKELLLHVPNLDVEQGQRIEEAPVQDQRSTGQISTSLQQDLSQEQQTEFFHDLNKKTYSYAERKDRNPQRAPGTCEWFTHHPLYTNWRDSKPSLLLVSADPGCGKSVLARFLVDEFSKDPDKIVCYFFFKDDFADQKTSPNAGCALLKQLLVQNSQNGIAEIVEDYKADGSVYFESFKDLWAGFVKASRLTPRKEIICILDAMDECQESDRRRVISSIYGHYSNNSPSKIKTIITSRPYSSIVDDFYVSETTIPIVHLSGDSDEEKEAISKEINIVIEHRIQSFGSRRHLLTDEIEFLLQKFIAVPQRTYLWAHLTLALLEETPGFTKGQARKIITTLPSTVDDAYNRILNRSINKAKTELVLRLIVAADKPLTVEAISYLLALDGTHESYEELQEYIETPDRFKDTIRQLCGLFVIVVDSKVYLLHQTAREFLVTYDSSKDLQRQTNEENKFPAGQQTSQLEWKDGLNYHRSQLIIAERCLRYLKLRPQDSNRGDLFRYCAVNWVRHLRESGREVNDYIATLALDVFESSSFLAPHNWFREYLISVFYFSPMATIDMDSIMKHFDSNVRFRASIPAISFIGIPNILTKYAYKNKIHEWDCSILSKALWWAAANGCLSMARTLLQMGAQTDAIAGFKFLNQDPASLEFLFRPRRFAVFKFLEPGDLPLPGWGRIRLFPTISNAIRNEDKPMVELLMAWTGRENITPDIGQELLQFAGKFNSDSIAYRLFEHDGCPATNALKEFWQLFKHNSWPTTYGFKMWAPSGQTFLHVVVEHGCLACTKFVLTQKVLVNAGYAGGTSLHLAAANNRPEIIRALLEAGASAELPNSELDTPLQVAMKHGSTEAIQELSRASARNPSVENPR